MREKREEMFFTVIPLWYYMALLPGIFIFPSEVSSSPGPQITIDPQNSPEVTMHSPTVITKESFHSDTVLQLTYSGLSDHLYPAVSGE